jgi:hypothetical protein
LDKTGSIERERERECSERIQKAEAPVAAAMASSSGLRLIASEEERITFKEANVRFLKVL